ncbi:MAG: hypothetical protein QGD94_12040 [Planctomycetia bacterium]|nr:hypothetical protein [Planctomycetia bacterium]
MNQRALVTLLIIFCVLFGALAIYSIVYSIRPGNVGEEIKSPGWAPYKCRECGYTFRITTGDSYALSQMRAEDPEADGTQIVCPKCGKRAAFLAKYCPQCRDWYLPAVYFDREAASGIRCPKCDSMRARQPPVEELTIHKLEEVK